MTGGGPWPPHLVGAGIGLLGCLSMLLSGRTLGSSTGFTRGAGMIERLFRGGRTFERPYFREVRPVLDWDFAIVAGIALGALLSALLSGDLTLDGVPSLWAGSFGPSLLRRLAAALAGGFLTGFGARWMGGCTSGHGISGTMQLSVASWLAVIFMFSSGIAFAFLLLGGR